jgi:hypothetical protein
MTQHFEVVYETKGVKVINVWLAPDQQLPEEWNTMTNIEKDEWLYDHQIHSNVKWQDEHKGEAVNVLPVAQLKAVI